MHMKFNMSLLMSFAPLILLFTIGPIFDKWRRRRTISLAAEVLSKSDPVLIRLVTMLLAEACKLHATRISFGPPPEASKASRLPSAPDDPEDSKKIDEIDALLKEGSKDFPPPQPFISVTSPLSAIPIYYRVDNQWVQADDIPLRLFHHVINYLDILHGCNPNNTVALDDNEGQRLSVAYQVGMTTDFCYYVDIHDSTLQHCTPPNPHSPSAQGAGGR